MTKKSKANKRRLSMSIISFTILILVAVFLREKIEDMAGGREKELSLLGTINVKWSKDTDMKGYSDSVVTANNGVIVSYDINGQKRWSKKLDNKNDLISLEDSAIYVSSQANGQITKINLKGKEAWKYETDNIIYTMVENDGHLIINSKVDRNIRNITVLNKSGDKVLEKERSNEEILSTSISKDKKNFAIVSMDSKSSDLKSKLVYLDDKEEIVWEKDFDDKIIYNVIFLKNNNMILIEDNNIICIDNEGKVLWNKTVDFNFKGVEVSEDDKIYILYGDKKSYLEVINSDGKIEYKKSFNKYYDHVFKSEKGLILLGKDEVIGINKDKINLKFNIQDEAKYINKFKDNIFIFKSDKIDIFKIVNK